MEDKQRFQMNGLKWLHELEFVNHPQVVNNIKMNVLMASKYVKEVELLIYREKKSMLVLVELSWFGRKFFRRRIFEDVHESLQQLLPSFRFRVIDDPTIMEKSVALVKQALSGGQNENTSNLVPSPIIVVASESNVGPSAETEIVVGRVEDLQADPQEQSVVGQNLFTEVSKDYSKEE